MTGPTDARVPLLAKEAADAAARSVDAPEYVTVLNLNRILLHHPVQARDFVQYFWDLMYEGSLDPRLREMAILRIAWTTGSVYEWTQHWHIAVGLAIPPEDLLAVRDWRAARQLSAADQAILAAADDVVEHGAVGPPAWTALVATLPSPALQVEALMAITGWRMVSSLLASLAVPLEEGVGPWPPDGLSPEAV